MQTEATAAVQRLGASMAQAQAALAGVGAVASMLDAFAAGVVADLLALAASEQQLLGVAVASQPEAPPAAQVTAPHGPDIVIGRCDDCGAEVAPHLRLCDDCWITQPSIAGSLPEAQADPATPPESPAVPMPAAAQVTQPEPPPPAVSEAPAESAAAAAKLSSAQLACLEGMRDDPAATIPATHQRTLDALAKRGLIEPGGAAGARGAAVLKWRLTEAGRTALAT